MVPPGQRPLSLFVESIDIHFVEKLRTDVLARSRRILVDPTPNIVVVGGQTKNQVDLFDVLDVSQREALEPCQDTRILMKDKSPERGDSLPEVEESFFLFPKKVGKKELKFW